MRRTALMSALLLRSSAALRGALRVGRRGVARAAAAHWVAVGAKLVVERNCLRDFYPAAFSRPVASVAALGTFAAALFVAGRRDDGVR